MKEWITKLSSLPFPALHMLIGLIAGLLIIWFVVLSINISIKKSRSGDLLYFKKRLRIAFRIFIPVLTIFISLTYADDSTWVNGLIKFFQILLIISTSFLLIRVIYALEDIFLEKYDIKKEDNRKERKIITQLNFIKKAIIVSIVVLAIAIILLSFDEGRKYGQTLLTSAGVLSIILGLAAQKSISNFFAGIQIAFTQPIKIDDAVVVENEWGWIEEINLTYVVVRVWDWRRLILPITYFVEKPFQNWTRNKGEIIGTVFLHLDYRAPIEKLRNKLTEVLQKEPKWDRKVDNLQVVDTKEYTIVVRALMSAKNSPEAWDLRCSVREKLVNFLREEHPESLPVQRIGFEKGDSVSGNR